MPLPLGTENSRPDERPTVFILHCGLDIRRVDRSCEKLNLALNLISFPREEVFSYYLRLDRLRPELIIIRSHFRSLIEILNKHKHIPTIVVSTQQRPTKCSYPFIRADRGYEGSDSCKAYAELARAMQKELSSG